MIATWSRWRENAFLYMGQLIRSFLTSSAAPRPLAWFRIGLAGVLLVQALGLIGHLDDLHGRHGVVAWSVISDSWPPAVPNLEWLDKALRWVGVPATFVVPLAFARSCFLPPAAAAA